jgi:phosphatidylinositol alpha-1,6-mannosyltransferase
VQDSEFVILSVGRLDTQQRHKGHDRIISQLAQLTSPSGKRLCYFVAGDGDDRGRLEELARENQVSDRVRFLGFVERSCLPDLYRASDLFALPSTGEGFGIVFLEAMACGTPAIGLKVGGAADPLADGELGWCVEADAFPEALQSAVSSPPPRHCQVLSQEIHERFGRRRFRERILEIFSSLERPSSLDKKLLANAASASREAEDQGAATRPTDGMY